MKVFGRYGSFRPKPQQAGIYMKRAKHQQQARQVRAVSLQAWLERHRSCANGCGQPVVFYDTIHYCLRYDGCCSPECEAALEERRAEERANASTALPVPVVIAETRTADGRVLRLEVDAIRSGWVALECDYTSKGDRVFDRLPRSYRTARGARHAAALLTGERLTWRAPD